ncbi:group-specific protein [Planococcus donghaensis MPA1U2]|uniref:Group-specific protein n=1 Tax=Planococcus donghaensis MPA1U2 TaxID=933115 RepID=E7REI7_9BACL|nr:DUF4878 domain-containing protein [Planococcus donghaensis]EGA90568.1 group-specific protein [Planococcus donghaensis MPA1U2]
MKKYKILISLLISAGILTFLTACGAEDPSSTVDEFLSAIQKNDFEKAGTLVQGGTDSLSTADEDLNKEEEELAMKVIESISKDYEFENLEEVSINEDKAIVKAEITSLDMGLVMTSTMAEIMPLAFANAFEEDTPETEKAFEEMTEKIMLKYITAEDAALVTRTVEFNLEKDENGNFKIIDDENLEEALFANISQLEDFLDEEGSDVTSNETTENQSEQTFEVLSVVAENKTYDADPINITLEELSFKKAINVSEDQQFDINNMYTDEPISDEFTYFYIKFHAENTIEQDVAFSGINEVVLFAEGKQEKFDIAYDWKDFIDYDEAQDADYYGPVSKEGEVGVVIKTDPAKVEKIRIALSESRDINSYETLAEEQIIEFDLTN